MTDKKIFNNLKKERLDRKYKIKMLSFMKADTNRKLVFDKLEEDERINLLSELSAIEINILKLRRNKFNSNFYEFKESSLYNRKERRE